MNVLCVGDIVGSAGRQAVETLLPCLKKEFNLDVVIVNAENSAGGAGITPKIADQLFHLGCDVLTLGDHVWDKGDIVPYLREHDKIIRPANFPDGAPGQGWCVKETKKGSKIGVINLLGRTFMRYNVTCPFRAAQLIAEEIRKITPVVIVDFHAEATSEKVAFGFFIDGKISAVVGTHTHVQTADEKIHAFGTAYISDLGMTGPYNSVIGQNKEKIIARFLTSLPSKFEVATEDIQLHGVFLQIDEMTGKTKVIQRIQRRLS